MLVYLLAPLSADWHACVWCGMAMVEPEREAGRSCIPYLASLDGWMIRATKKHPASSRQIGWRPGLLHDTMAAV